MGWQGLAVMIKPRHPDPSIQQALQWLSIGISTQIQHGYAITRLCADLIKQPNITFGAGDQRRIAWVMQPQLMQRAQAIGIAIEHVKVSHAGSPKMRNWSFLRQTA